MMVQTHTVDLPWPQCWDQMQWLIAAWLARYGARACVQVCWNETLLSQQVDAAAFQAATTDFYRALQQRLDGACEWRLESNAASVSHRVVISVCTSSRT